MGRKLYYFRFLKSLIPLFFSIFDGTQTLNSYKDTGTGTQKEEGK